MKKLALSAVIGLLLSTTAFANVVVFQDGKVTTYKPGTEIAINAKTTARVLYDGVLITIPQGQKVQISKEEGKIKLFGVNMKGVEIAGKQISSKGQATVSVTPSTGEVASVKGATTIVSNDLISTNKGETKEGNKQADSQRLSRVPGAPPERLRTKPQMTPETSRRTALLS